jgi:hypothetical protein
MFVNHLDQNQLARRWAMSPRTLERWRWLHIGPIYLKIGKRIVYRVEDVEAFEAARLHQGDDAEPLHPMRQEAGCIR